MANNYAPHFSGIDSGAGNDQNENRKTLITWQCRGDKARLGARQP